MSKSFEQCMKELQSLNCSQDNAKYIMYLADRNGWDAVKDKAEELFGNLQEDYEYWHTYDRRGF
tara:strand:+ start:2114 stop:2305 length:192 start_codon:yes stop_codon:yes gene_type:complete